MKSISPLFQASDLCHAYGPKTLFSHLSILSDNPGLILISGDNGSGKSTLLKGLSGFQKLDQGKVFYNGTPVAQLKSGTLSFVPATSLGLNPELTGQQHIQLFADSLNVSSVDLKNQIETYSELKIFEEIYSQKIKESSQGMRQLLRVFLHTFFKPEVLFLDEPFMFLSPAVKEFVLARIFENSRTGFVFIADQNTDWISSNEALRIKLGGV